MNKDNQSPAQPEKRTLLKTALAAGATGIVAAAGGIAWGTKKGKEEEKAALMQHNPESYDCYGMHQAGITTPPQQFGIMAAFDVSAKNQKDLEKLLRIITARIEFLTHGGELQDEDIKLPPSGSGILGKVFQPDGLTITVSVGSSLFDERFGLADKKPIHLQELKDFFNDKLQAQWCDGDLSIQICAFSPETCQNALRDIIKNTANWAVIRWSIDGFLPKTQPGSAPRNLLGFHDGTANPDVSDPKIADEVLWTGIAANSMDEPAWTKNGTYQAVRIIRHFVEFWDRTPLQEQQTIFGREKYSGAPLGMQHEQDTPDYSKDPDGEVIPTDSHIRVANPRDPEFMKKHQLFRRPFDYSRGLSKAGQLDVGLVFICYQANLEDGFIFVQKLLDTEPLEEYISPFGGGYFFTLPGIEKGEFLGQSLLTA
ncbi:iron uptake transporter deferrochelatase/peroxidase subunit [Neisseria montereyensis]|uniref:Deferrochelatase n=1 Tax=Neisseria montereyensis TaxID=2973938 RepID=A0ABT2FET5_9NEIS|nr:iron uptake transporter deferrochelatase/peroxidase subunit [Neisseria montereyensis]MCS4534668.1 iron uptake transporter deferrochelatase/peroxidase subunit [Neisseria montereyensis]